MYINSLHLYGIRCFGKAEMLNCWHPERRVDPQTPMPEHLRNVNVLLGNNGAGKSSVLRAIALAALSPVIVESGYVPYRLVRRPVKGASLVKASVVVHR